jgi:predicted aconitase
MILCADQVVEIGAFHRDCNCQTCVSACDQYEYEILGLDQGQFEKNRRYLEIAKKAGVNIVNSCTPYLTGWIPIRGEHFVTTESSNVLICNSLFSAMGNADGLEAAAWAAICGRTPKWGNHLWEKRLGTQGFEIQCPSATAFDWDIIGFTLGRLLDAHAIPVLTGGFSRPDLDKLKYCFASMATTSCAEMCHIVGYTPEAATLDMATGGKDIPITPITQKDYEESVAMLRDHRSGPVDLVILGCPHYSLREIREIAEYLGEYASKGQKVKEGVRLLIFTDIPIKEAARVNGFQEMIAQAGGHLLTSGCPLVFGKKTHENAQGILSDSGKQTHYLKSESEARIYCAPRFACIDAAISGYWEGK